MAYYSKYTGAELEEKLDKIEEIPQLIAQMITGKDFVTKEDLLCVLRDYAPADYSTIPIDHNTIYWENGVLKAIGGGSGSCQWELKEHNGVQYLFSRLPVVTQYDVTMYADVNRLDLPSIYDGLPIDGDTIYWEETENGRILKSKYEGSSGVDASEVLSIVSSAGYATQSWVNSQNFISSTLLYTELAKYVKIKDYQEIEGVKNFLNGLQIAGLPITKLNGYEDVIYIDANLVVRGGVTMYAENEVDIPSIIDSLPIASNTALGIASFDSTYFSVDSNGMVSLTSAPSSISTIGSLQDVSSSVSGTTNSDVVLFKSANSNTWTTKPLSEIGGGSSGVVGDYLPLSGGTINGNSGLDLIINTSYSEYNLIGFKQNNTYRGYVGVEADGKIGLYSYVSHSYLGINSSGEPYVQNDKLNQIYTILHAGNYSSYALPLSGGTIDSNNTSPLALKSNVSECGIRIELGSNSRGWIGYNLTHGVTLYNYFSQTYGISLRDNGNVILCQDGGYVGIGVSSPDCRVDVAGDIATNNYLRIKAWPGYGNGSCSIWFDGNSNTAHISSNILVSGGITMYSDQRKKTILNHVELSLKQIADAPLIEHYYNSDQNKTTHVGSIAQYWAGLNDWFCKLDNEGFYTMEIQNCALASAISIARHLEKYESKTDKKIRQLKKRISQLEDELELLKKGV